MSPPGRSWRSSGARELHRGGSAGRGRLDPVLRHRRPHHAVRPGDGAVTVFREPSGRANGLIFDPKGRLIAAEGANTGGGRRVSITERDGTVRTLADRYKGKRFNSPNDVAVDRQGRVYVSDPRYVGDEPRELDFEGVFRIDPDGTVDPARDDRQQAERPGRQPRRQDPLRRRQRPEAPGPARARPRRRGNVSHPRVLSRLRQDGGIDGMTVTVRRPDRRHGRLGRQGGRLRLHARGQAPAGFIPAPESPTNVEFGGPDRKTLYITAGRSLYRVAPRSTGYHLWPSAQ